MVGAYEERREQGESRAANKAVDQPRQIRTRTPLPWASFVPASTRCNIFMLAHTGTGTAGLSERVP